MKSMKSKKIPAFFKPFIAEDREQRLLIPPFLAKFMKDRMPHSAFIRDHKGNHWHVEVSQRENKDFFEAGWSKFVQWGDCLLFEYDGESFFDVKIFGDTACEKEFGAEVFEAHVKEEMEEEEGEEIENDEDQDQDKIVVLRDAKKRKQNNKKDNSSSGGRGNNPKSTKQFS